MSMDKKLQEPMFANRPVVLGDLEKILETMVECRFLMIFV